MIKESLPSRVRKLHVRSRKLVESLFAGNYQSVFRGPGLEFDEAREYEYGDDVRFIDWNVSSRMGTPYSKTFREERELILFVLMDVSSSLTMGSREFDKRDVAGNLFALLALAAVANNDRVGSLLFSDKVEKLVVPMKSRCHVLRQISEVLGYRAKGKGSNLALAIRTVSHVLKRKSIVLVLSDFRMEGYQEELTLLARRHDVIAIRLTDSLDRNFPPVGLVEIEDMETGENLTILGDSPSFCKDYREFWEDRRADWLRTCRKAGVDTLEVDTEEEPSERLRDFFRHRRKYGS